MKAFARGVRGALFFNDTATTEIYTLTLHDALPISDSSTLYGMERSTIHFSPSPSRCVFKIVGSVALVATRMMSRSEEHTSELQSRHISSAVFCLKKKNSILSLCSSCLTKIWIVRLV